jgi:ABC-2 type transport system permease protein
MRMRRTAATGWFRLRIMEFGRFWGYRPHLEAVLKRDFWMFFRDPMQRVHLLMMLFLVCAVVFAVRSLNVVISRPASLVLSFTTVFVFVGFVVSSIILRFVFPAVSLEGDAFWAVRTAPITLSRLYWMKFAIALVLTLVPAEMMLLVTLPALRGPSSLLTLATTGMAGVVVALVSLNLGSGAYFATLKEKNPVKVASSQGASVTFLGSLAILLIVAGVLALPASVVTGALVPRIPALPTVIALAGITLIACVVTVLSHQMGLRALRKDL